MSHSGSSALQFTTLFEKKNSCFLKSLSFVRKRTNCGMSSVDVAELSAEYVSDQILIPGQAALFTDAALQL